MEEQLVKRRRGDDGSAIAIDRLSQLRQPILQRILCLLSQKDAVRTSVLSKSWRYLWHGRLNVEFVEHWFAGKEEIGSFIDRTLQRYLDQNLSLQQLIVDMSCNPKSIALLKKWIPIVLNMGVKSLSFIFSSYSTVSAMPLIVFQAEHLVELHLQRCSLNALKSTDNVMLNNLQTLRLHFVEITDGTFEKIISSCPLIENVDLVWCHGLKFIKLHKHHNVKYFHCWATGVYHETIIEIEDPHSTLESVRIHKCQKFFHHRKNLHFPHLKSLHLHNVQLPVEIFNNFSSSFPRLNELILDSCYGLKEFLLLSRSIKRLTIKMDPNNKIKAFIDAPNILYFRYFECPGYGFLPSIKFATTSNEWNSDISVWYEHKPLDKDATSWFLKLNKLLKALSQSHITLNLRRAEYKNLHINDSYGGFCKPVVVKHLRLSAYFSSSSVPAILNGFFRICRPRYIYTDQYVNVQAKCKEEENNPLAEFLCKLIPKKIGCYFWLQDLEEVSLEVPDIEGKEWQCVKGTSLPALPSNQFIREIRFRLTWREQLSRFT